MMGLSEIYIKQPGWFWLVPVIIVLVFFLRSSLSKPQNWLNNLSSAQYRHPAIDRLKTLQPRQNEYSSGNLFTLLHYSILTCLFATSLTQPYQIVKRLPDPPEHKDIVLLVDTSISMVLKDYLVSGVRTERMTVMKNVISHFIEQLKGNRIKIIAFSEQAYTFVPFTTDYTLLKYQIQRLDPATLTGRSSDLSHALLYALQTIEQTDELARPVFVMLTDANRPVRKIDPRIAAKLVADKGIRLHTIAIGAGSYRAEDKDDITLIYHPTSFSLLKDIASAGQGQFFWARDTNDLGMALNTINQTEKRKIVIEPELITRPLYYWPLLAAILWLSLTYSSRLFSLLHRRYKRNVNA